MGAAALALPSLEVAVGGRGGSLAGGQLVRVHPEAHRAAGVPPLGTGLGEHLVEALRDRLEGDPYRARHDEHPYAVGDPAAPYDLGGGAQVLDAPIGAGTYEDGVHTDVAQGLTGRQPHVFQGLFGGEALRCVFVRSGVGDVRRKGCALARVGAPGDERRQLGGVHDDLVVEDRVVVGAQGLPVRDGGVPVGSLGRVVAALEVGEGGLVGGDHAGPGARLDGHVADGHPGLHRELLDGLAAVLDDVALAAAGADPGDDGEDQVLGGDAVGQLALDGDGHGLEGRHRQRLGGEHVLDLAGADAEGQRAEGAVGGGVAVAADHGGARLGQSQLRSHYVDDSLFDVAQRVQPDAELRAVLAQRLQLGAGDGVGDGLVDVEGGGVVVLGGDGEVGAPHRPAGLAQAVERLRAGHLVEQVQVDEEEVGLAFGAPDDVVVPDLLRECPCHRFPSGRPHCRPNSTVYAAPVPRIRTPCRALVGGRDYRLAASQEN